MVTLEGVLRAIAAAEKRAKQIRQPMNITAAGQGGNLRELMVRTLGSGVSSRLR